MQQYFIEYNLEKEQRVVFHKEQAHHIKNVLRMKTGEQVKVVDANQQPYLVEVQMDHEISGTILEKLEPQLDKVKITLIQGMIKGDRWDFLLQKACELGVHTIIPMISSRSVVKINDKIEKKVERFNKIALEACEQSKREHLVQVMPPINFNDIPKYGSELNLIAYEDADQISNKLKTLLASHPDTKEISIVIGSEGGFSQTEVAYLETNNFIRISLGNRILRAETAAMAAINALTFYYE